MRELVKITKEQGSGDIHKVLVETISTRPFVLHTAFIYLTTEGSIEGAELQTFLTTHKSDIESSFVGFSDGGDHWVKLREALEKHEYAKELLENLDKQAQEENLY